MNENYYGEEYDYIASIPDDTSEDDVEMKELTTIINAMCNGTELYVSDVITDIDRELKKHQNKLFLIAGVGAGKSSWVKDVLAKKGNVLFVTSRRAKVDEDINDSCFENVIRLGGEEHQTLITNAKLAKILENMNLKSGFMTIDQFLDHYDYIVIDEVHSMVTDSTFAKSSFGLLNFIEYVAKKKKNIICMTGTPEPVKEYFKKNRWYSYDFRRTCVYVKPKKIVTIRKEEIISIIQKELEKNNKIVYFVNDTKSIKDQYEALVKAHLVESEEISAIVAENNRNKLAKDLEDLFGDKNKKLIEVSQETYKSIVEEKLLPDDCKILLSTSKLKEGVDILNDNTVIICDNHILTNIIQFCGRVRNGTEVVYIVEDAMPHPNKPEKVLYKYSKEEAVAGNYFLNKYVEKGNSPFSKISTKEKKSDKEILIDHVEDNRYCRFNYITNEFQRFHLLYKEELRLKKSLQNWKDELVEYCLDYGIQPPTLYPWKAITETVLKRLYEQEEKLYIHKDSQKIDAIKKLIWHLPTTKKAPPQKCKGLSSVLKENGIEYTIDSVPGGDKKKESETYWYVKK